MRVRADVHQVSIASVSGQPETSIPRNIVGGGQDQKYRFTVLRDGLVRYEWAPDSQFEDRPSAFAAHRNSAAHSRTVPDLHVKETDDALEITTSRFHLTYNKQEFSPYGLFVVVPGFTRQVWRYGEPCETLGGTARTLDGVDGRTDIGHGVVSRNGFAFIDDSDTMLFEEDGFVAPRRPGAGRVDGYLFAYGHDYREAVKAFYSISGPPPMLPRWVLGNWWSRYYAYTAESYLALMDEFRENGIPLSVAIIDMDWHLVDDPRVIEAGTDGWTGYTWNKKLFPDPPGFMSELHKRGLRTALNDHPANGVYPYEDLYGKMAKALHRDPSKKEPIPFNITDRAYLDAYLSILIRSLEDDGMDFVWMDWQQGPYSRLKGIDPLWVLNHFHFLHNAASHPSRHPLVFSRYAGPGSHRYPVGFSGDAAVSWASLAFQPEFTAAASNVGYGWWSHDLGGHMAGGRDDELTARWVQLGAFSPVTRLHSAKSRWVAKEPWRLPKGGPREAASAALRLRHRMLPYLQRMNVRAAEEGLPLVQPMYWEHPEREEAYAVPNQYLFGSEMVVAPITASGDPRLKLGRVRAWLPPGRYADFFTGVVYDGDREMWLSRPLEQCPVLMREGSIVPLDAAQVPANGAGNPETGYEIVLVVGADGFFEILEEAEDGSCSRTPVRFTQASGRLEVGPFPGLGGTARDAEGGEDADEVLPDSPLTLNVRLLGIKKPRLITIEAGPSAPQPQVLEEANGLLIAQVLLGRGSGEVITFDLGPHPQLDHNDAAGLIEPIIRDAQIEYRLKDAVWDVVSARKVSTSVKLGRLQALEMSESLRVAVMELLLADNRI
ncbi:Alpha-xylosidase [Pleurostoma richardsiae]|uniref:alpha-glucosidase n=1 Tax=Pleurostoma richardsiae TaxID=41990 RepID=A0AA38VI17_9PEZI|nr:Alpha-xylosidase [Pleurostoma richardsiae]